MKALYYLIMLVMIVGECNPAVVVRGDDSVSPYGFSTPINSIAYDSYTGYFFVGVNTPTNINYSVARASRPTFAGESLFTPIATNAALQGHIAIVTLASQLQGAPFVVVLKEAEQVVHVATVDGATVDTSIAFNDATGSAVTSDIESIAASSHSIFAAVAPSSGVFMQSGSGIALLKIVTTNNNQLSSVQVKDATTGLDGNKAAALDISSSAVTGGGANVTAQNQNVSLYYDSVLDRLYVGIQVTTAGGGGNAHSVVVGYLADTNILNIEAPVATSALSAANTIVSAQGNGISVTAIEPRVLHATTGPDYLIVNGGQGAVTAVGNTVYALPLVNDPGSPLVHGTLAKKDAPLTNGVFIVPATAVGDLPINTDVAAIVGGGPLPMPANVEISDMVVRDDTVYVSLNTIPGATQDTGIFSSQALFDSTGKILRWTPWRFHVITMNEFPGMQLPGGATHDGRITFFDVDQQTGNIWFVEGTTDRVVGITAWNKGAIKNDFLSTLNNFLSMGSYAALDLDRNTRGFNATNYRYALFGGNDIVLFINTSVLNGDQEVSPIAFSVGSGTVLSTTIEGTVRALEYSRAITGTNDNYFFAGTENGLFVFADSTGNGFDVNTLGLLNTAPFVNRTWQKIPSISGEILAIKTSGMHSLYVLARQLTYNENSPFITTLYNIPFISTLSDMFAPSNILILAQSGTGSFAQVTNLTDMAIIATGGPGSADGKEQLVLATNNGLFFSTASQAGPLLGIPSATSDGAAGWTQFAGTQKVAFNSIASINTPVRNTVWPLNVVDPSGALIFDHGTMNQLSGYSSDGITISMNSTFIPSIFNSKNNQTGFLAFDLLGALFSDGARRLFIADRGQDPADINVLESSPFDPRMWAMTGPYVLVHPVINQQNRFYWISQIGATGILAVGTDGGVIGLY